MRSELIERLRAHLSDNDVKGLNGKSYQIELDGTPLALWPSDGRYLLEERQLEAADCTLKLDSATLEQLISKPSLALLLIARKKLVVDQPMLAAKLGTVLHALL
jgi:hypothetical protein